MSEFPFQAGGPLVGSSPVYVLRGADDKAATHLRRMEYITLIEPRQHGKSSLINQLIARFSSHGYTFAMRDLMAAKASGSTATEWYTSLGSWLIRQLRFVPQDQRPKLPTDSASWEGFLAELAESAQAARQNVVIILDEIGAMPSDWATEFFSVIRSVYTTRQNFRFWHHLTFIIAGAFNPKELIRDSTVSNFNIDQRIPLNDLDLSEVCQLVSHLHLPSALTKAVAERIHYWTDGQPYVCQWLCLHLTHLKEPITVAGVDDAVEHFFQDDIHHLCRIRDLADEPDLLSYARRIIREPRPRFSAALNDKHFRLAHIVGIIKAGPDGLCQIRNRICERALAEVESSTVPKLSVTPALEDEFRYDAFISYSHNDSTWVRDTLLPRLENEALRVCIDYRDFEIGAPSLVNMENAVETSRKTLLVLTPNWIASQWTEFEALLIQTKDPAGRGRRILPLMVTPCALPDRLRVFTYLDLAKPAQFEFQMKRLVAAIRPVPQKAVAIEAGLGQEPTRTSRPPRQGFRHERGLAALGELLAQDDTQVQLAFAVLESRLLDNLRDEGRCGINDIIRSERARVMEELNRLALSYLGRSFNELCKS